jgi:hypothetical protein
MINSLFIHKNAKDAIFCKSVMFIEPSVKINSKLFKNTVFQEERSFKEKRGTYK